MNPTLFADWVNRYFPGITLRISERYNDATTQPTYLFQSFLRPEYSVDGKWESFSANHQLVAADVIAMDSSIPLKARPALGRASGDITKLGLELASTEKDLSDIQTLIARQSPDSVIVAKIFNDTPLVIGGVYERLEAMFLEGLSSGVTEIDDTETVGTGVRLTYGYRTENQFESTVSWDDPTAVPFTDMQQVLDKASADGNAITRVMMDRTTFNRVAATAEGKSIFAAAYGIFSATVPVPTLDQMNTATQARFGFVIQIVDRSIRTQLNGTNTSFKPWKAGSVVFLTSNRVGSLVYTRLAEMDMPVAGVNYQTVNSFILVSKYSVNRPSLKEFTNSQARVVPVISGVDSIYLLDSTQDNP